MTTIRRIREGDGEALFRVFLASIRELASTSYSAEQLHAWTSHISPSRLEHRLLRTVGLAAQEEGEIVGFSALDAAHAELDFLYVHPHHVRKGIGRQLTACVEQEALRRGIARLELTASINATAAYERLGYRRMSNMTKTIEGIVVPCIRMDKELRPEGRPLQPLPKTANRQPPT